MNAEDAQKALRELKQEDKDVQLAKQREQDPTNLYFANLPSHVDEQMLTEVLQQRFQTKVSSARVMRERSGHSKCVGFARIDESRVCDQIIDELNNKPFPGDSHSGKVLLVKLADSGSSKKKMSLSNDDTITVSSQMTSMHQMSANASLNNSYSATNPQTNTNAPPVAHHQAAQYHHLTAATYNGFPIQPMYEPMHLNHHHQLQHQMQYQRAPAAPVAQNSAGAANVQYAAATQSATANGQPFLYYVPIHQHAARPASQQNNTAQSVGNAAAPNNANQQPQGQQAQTPDPANAGVYQMQQQFAGMALNPHVMHQHQVKI